MSLGIFQNIIKLAFTQSKAFIDIKFSLNMRGRRLLLGYMHEHSLYSIKTTEYVAKHSRDVFIGCIIQSS